MPRIRISYIAINDHRRVFDVDSSLDMDLMHLNTICCCLISFLIRYGWAASSITSNGSWVMADGDICAKYLCSSSGLTWKSPQITQIYDRISGCEALIKKGVSSITFHGDSFVRHIYAALMITLNGDFKYGSIHDGKMFPECHYHEQFTSRCKTMTLNKHGVVCEGKIKLNPELTYFQNLDECKSQQGSVIIWSFGNHPLPMEERPINDKDQQETEGAPPTTLEEAFHDTINDVPGPHSVSSVLKNKTSADHLRNGINNATMWSGFFKKDICQLLSAKLTRCVSMVIPPPLTNIQIVLHHVILIILIVLTLYLMKCWVVPQQHVFSLSIYCKFTTTRVIVSVHLISIDCYHTSTLQFTPLIRPRAYPFHYFNIVGCLSAVHVFFV